MGYKGSEGVGIVSSEDHSATQTFLELDGLDHFFSTYPDGQSRRFMKLSEAIEVGVRGTKEMRLKNAICLDNYGHLKSEVVFFPGGTPVKRVEKV